MKADTPLPRGQVTLKMVYVSDADKAFSGADVTLLANEKQIGKGRVEKGIPNRVPLDETLDIGFDTGTPIAEDYVIPFTFKGTLHSATIELKLAGLRKPR